MTNKKDQYCALAHIVPNGHRQSSFEKFENESSVQTWCIIRDFYVNSFFLALKKRGFTYHLITILSASKTNSLYKKSSTEMFLKEIPFSAHINFDVTEQLTYVCSQNIKNETYANQERFETEAKS